MIVSLPSSLFRVTIFWYILGALVLFFGHPEWAETRYLRLANFPWVPEIELRGLSTAAEVQWILLGSWSVPVFLLWVGALVSGVVASEFRFRIKRQIQAVVLRPNGSFWGVKVRAYSLGALPKPTTPELTGPKVSFGGGDSRSLQVSVEGAVKEALKMLTPVEKQLCEELIQVLAAKPDHYAGLGHGVGLLEHTLNVASEVAPKVTPEFRLPLIAALGHDIGKLLTFQQDESGEWVRKGLHSKESARILATLPAFQQLPELHQRGLLLAIKYDHAPSKMPCVRGDEEARTLAMRIISSLAMADKAATAAEKERHIEKLQPEDLLWKDFSDFLRKAPVVQLGKKGAANQVNNPPDGQFLYIYEAAWRDAAIKRIPAEVAAALDVTRRDSGKLAKYTAILAEMLRKADLLVEELTLPDPETGELREQKTSLANPLWDIQSGEGEKAMVMRGILVLKADALWKKLNYRLGAQSPYAVRVLAPNADVDGKVNQAPRSTTKKDGPSGTPEAAELKVVVTDVATEGPSIGLTDAEPAKLKPRARRAFKDAPAPATSNEQFGLVELKEESQAAPPDSTSNAVEFLLQQAASSAPAKEEVLPESLPVDEVEAPADTPNSAQAPELELSRAEKREGLALADEATVALYPGLKVGDKYYTEQSRAVHDGRKKVGAPYRGDVRDRGLNLTEAGPRRARRALK